MNLNCPKCLDKFLEPKILPCCGKSLCNYCISIIQDRKKFKCFYCSKVYELPEELPLDEKLISELDAKLGMEESILSETAKNFKSLINIIQKNITQAEFEFKNGDYVINEYCSELKRQVQLAKELKIQAIELNDIKLVEMKTENFNEKSDQIFMLIEKFQNDSLKSYELFDKSKFIEKLRMSITIQKSKFASKLTTIKSMLEKWNNIANDPTSNDQTLLKETHSAQDAQSRLAVSIDEFKSICFRGKIAEFYQHDGKNSFGTLKFSWFNQINIKNFEYIDLMPHIKNIRGHADLNKEKDFLFLHDQYEFLCVCLENLHTVVFVRDRQGVNRNTLILFLFDEKKQIKDTKLMHLGEYAYFGFIRACGNKVVFSYGHDDEIKSFLCVLDEHLNLLHKIEHENNQLLVGANESFIYTSSNSEQAKASLNLKQSPIFVYDWSLKLVKKVGQRKNKKGAFYLPNYIFNLEFRNEKYYIFEEYSNDECRMNIIDEQTGLQIKSIQINDHLKCSHIDSDNRLILVNYQSLIYLSPNGEVLKKIKITNCPDFGHFWHFDRNNTLHLCTYNKDDDKERKLLFKRLKF